MSAISKKRVVSCPQCGQPAEFSADNPYRPFCSKRCQLVDLGDWANERFRIPDSTPPALDDEQPN
ncbi:MAG: DNA gyrase inhibitor YacG [Methylophilaceae bacterium 17-44-8]|nr:MAG: DNA gyrase inhibitor YacG [Methylophilales bacterium 28-44-11]OYY99763.1 MAG: DNA gyrase inhibitor YacG [Methylophilales bacterium 16-45-7]OZA05068.1 MAG: DNA gyrase inhibitor YacG [Methylophilaceae bacterium 17-44-8]